MATEAFQKIYTKISQITKATCSLKAKGVGYDELATINGKLAQVVKIAGDNAVEDYIASVPLSTDKQKQNTKVLRISAEYSSILFFHLFSKKHTCCLNKLCLGFTRNFASTWVVVLTG